MTNRTISMILFAAGLTLVACDVKTKAVDHCGDGILDPGEDCDGTELAGQSCGSLGHYNTVGLLGCRSDCSFDLSDCGGSCGDGVIQVAFAEECDMDSLAGATCESRGFVGGVLGCTQSCSYDTSLCESRCGNGVLDTSEPCDGFELRNMDCLDLGYSGGQLNCSAVCSFDESECQNVCGNNLLEPSEECDDQDLRGLTCESLGYTSGVLACNSCQLVRLQCEGSTTCGDGILDGDEACDLENLNGTTCMALGFIGGTLGCGLDCRFNTSRCMGSTCGDGRINGNEDCDGSEFSGATCELLGQGAGTLSCGSDCMFNLVGCSTAPFCGNQVVEGGEDCDGADLDDQTCISLGYSVGSGALGCNQVCEFDEGACLPKSSNADLSGLDVSPGTLAPVFDPEVVAYEVSVAESTNTITISATTADPLASVEIAPAQPMDLTPGENPATVTVTAENGAIKVYEVLVIRMHTDLTSPNIGLLKHVPGDTFQRDSTPGNLSTVSSFWMSEKEITRAQYVLITGLSDPSNVTYSTGTSDPVQMVNWYHALVFCNKLSMTESLTPVYSIGGSTDPAAWGAIPSSDNPTWDSATADWAADGYRLPTEMEWLWAAMGADDPAMGYAKPFSGSDGNNNMDDYVWYAGNAWDSTHPAGSKLPNELGLYDMSGNVMEWCWDWVGTPPVGALTDYRGAASGYYRALRGGCYYNDATFVSLDYPDGYYPSTVGSTYGFRVIRQ
ncbi:SUMF1/EgtB/PvdO family nonheme iron enzyme [Myxococcota bacterium]|nr:SUMF1/EgtB/PvdO family nonheme iron enzyme [Myxococcota bacterium]MBU1412027.1 SUMF1/EgtB/PvdO family nonheme iron enzyme [Myxococcota bacterium]